MTEQAFIRNRAEELGLDMWGAYILPPYFNKLGFRQARKSIILEGGRGCGKTALLRYLSYATQFSPTRRLGSNTPLETVGLYLKADPHYFSAYNGCGITEDKWQQIFEHSLCLALAEQIIGALQTLNCSHERRGQFGHLNLLNFNNALSGFSRDAVPPGLDEFENWLRTRRNMLSRWFRNADEEERPELFSLREFVSAIANEIRNKLPYLRETVFTIFIDEYENLLDYQQRFLNSLIKGGEPPLIFHIAMKPNGMRTRMTTGTESIQEVADYRRILLDEEIAPDFDLFAAELFFFRLVWAGLPEVLTPIQRDVLQCEDQIDYRLSTKSYRGAVLSTIRRVLPGEQNQEAAAAVFRDDVLLNRWRKLVGDALKEQGSRLNTEDFLLTDYPEAALICAALLHQRSKSADDVYEELRKHAAGADSKFIQGEWIHHYLTGTLLLIYLPFRQRPCPFYAGFDAFQALAGTNIRYFLELCHQSVGDLNVQQINFAEYSVPIAVQARSAHRASKLFKDEVEGCGDLGSRLLAIVNCLGKLFRMSQGRPSQSEPERTHFAIVNGTVEKGLEEVLVEAVKWSVFFREPESKVKANRYEASEYILNPIYAPFFGISYNKGRKLELSASHAKALLGGNALDLTDLIQSFEKQWRMELSEQFTLDFDQE